MSGHRDFPAPLARGPGVPGRLPLLLALLLSASLPALIPETLCAQIAIQGERVHPVSGPMIPDGVILVSAAGVIEAVGPAADVPIPDGYRVLSGAVVTPGLVDARAVVGLAGHLNVPHDQDQMDLTHAIQPELRAFDAYNARERLVEWVRNHGVTTVQTGHAPGPLVSGQTMIVKTRGRNVSEAMVDSVSAVAMTLGSPATGISSASPGSRPMAVAMLRQELVRAREYAERRASADETRRGARNLRHEALVRILDREIPALITAHRDTDIMAALRLADEFGFDLVLDGAAESYLLVEEIRAAGVPVVLHAPLAVHSGVMENATYDTPRILMDAGIPVTIQTGFEQYVPKARVLLFEAAPLVGHGLSFDEVLSLITLDAARILRLDDRVGSLEVGKDGDVVLYDGDPFEYASRVCAVVIEGEVVSEECH